MSQTKGKLLISCDNHNNNEIVCYDDDGIFKIIAGNLH